jgi:hypothetical protein
MLEEEWGFFIDLELHPIPNKKEIDKETHEKIQKIQKIKSKVIKPLGKNGLSIIYEDEIWYRRDEEDDCDYKKPTWEYSDEKTKKKDEEKEKILATTNCINKITTVLYCVICASFISWSFLA